MKEEVLYIFKKPQIWKVYWYRLAYWRLLLLGLRKIFF
jgi:hypothetical protein